MSQLKSSQIAPENSRKSSHRMIFYRKLLFLPFLLLLSSAFSEEKGKPSVLFLGDSVHRNIFQAAAKELGQKISVHYPPRSIEVADSRSALERIEDLLGNSSPDIIYFNYGIGDLCYRDPATREIRIMSKQSGGVRVSSPAQYEQQLDTLVRRLKSSNAKLIWGSTTPLVNINFFPSFQGIFFDPHSEQEYNTIASRVMAKHKVPVLNLHRYIMEKFQPDEAHPPYNNYLPEMQKRGHPLHEPIVRALLFVIEA